MLPALEKTKTYRQLDRDFSAGLWHRDGYKPGTYYAGENMSGDAYPALSSRPPRRTWLLLSEGMQGMCCADYLYLACDGELLRAEGQNQLQPLGQISAGSKIFGVLGSEILILPDFKVLNTETNELKGKASTLVLAGVMVQNQDYVDVDGVARTIKFNTLHCVDFNFRDYYKAGDSVHISGTDHNDGIYTIREVEEYDLRFDEYAFVAETMDKCTIQMKVPALEGMCACGGRLWGFAGDTIYASAPGCVHNWYRYDHDAQSSFAVRVPGNGPITACTMHAGRPVFFKANSVIEVYGDSPENFSVLETPLSGVMAGSAASLCTVGGDMMYLSYNGVIRCSGSTATVISEALGCKLTDGIAATDGRRYYLSAVDEQGVRALYVYDTVTRAWQRESGEGICHMAYLNGDVYAYCDDSTVYILGQDNTKHGTVQESVRSFVEFHPLRDDERGQIVPVRLGVRIACKEGSSLSLAVSYNGAEWETRAQIACTGERIWYVPLLARACDSLRVRVQGTGEYRVLSLVREYK